MEASRGNADLLTAVLDSLAEAAVVFRPSTGAIVYANRAFSDLTAISLSQVSEKTFYYYVGNEVRQNVSEALLPLFSGAKRQVELDFRLEVPLRPSRLLHGVFSLAAGSAKRPLVCAGLSDVTDHRGEVAQLEARLKRADGIINSAPQAIFVTDNEGGVRRTSRGATRLLGYEANELYARRYLQDLLEGDAERDVFEPLRTSSEGILERQQAICIAKSRERIPVLLSSHRLLGVADEPVGFCHFVTDMRKNLEMERKLEEVQLQLIHADKMASLGKLAAGVAHEINNPLGGILLFGGLMLEDMDFSDPRREDMTRIVQEARRCKEIVNSLLDFAHQKKRYYEPVDVNAAVEQCLSLLGNKALFQNIRLAKELAPGLPPVTGNPSQIKQVFTNIISNAVDAMDQGGALTIRSFLDEARGEVCVSFLDTGPGVPPAIQARVFDPFFTTKEQGKGTGLGLSLSFNIIRMHRGDIRVRNVPGAGAEFTVALPCMEEEAS